MKTYRLGGRGFRGIEHEAYPPHATRRLLQESSAIDTEEDGAFENPGSSYLWVGDDHHLNRKQVKILRDALDHWLFNGRLPEEVEDVLVDPGREAGHD